MFKSASLICQVTVKMISLLRLPAQNAKFLICFVLTENMHVVYIINIENHTVNVGRIVLN